MNDKFKQLALEAKMGTADFDVGSYYVATPDRMQKLCELIVRECVGVVEGGSFLHDQAPTAQFARKYTNQTIATTGYHLTPFWKLCASGKKVEIAFTITTMMPRTLTVGG
jgi:hypothetical protein